MKIVHLITRLIIGGAQENTVLSCRGLVDLGHDVALVSGLETGFEGSLWDQAKKSGATLVAAKHLRRRVHPWHDLRAVSELTRLLREFSPDVVHTHSSKAGILGRIAAHRAKVPIIIHTIHGMSFNRTQGRLTNQIYRALERYVAPLTTKFVTVADAMIEQSVSAGITPRDRFVTIRSGMDTERFSPDREIRARVRSAWGLSEEHMVVGTIARLFDNKGYDEIIAALPAIATGAPLARFVWIGEGKHRTRYEAVLQKIGLRDRVIFCGLVPPDRVAELINGFDLVLHASRWEGLPRAVVQGLLMEKPAVSFDNDGAPEVVQPYVTGLLAPVGHVDELSRSVLVLCRDSELRTRLGKAGRASCLEVFGWRKMASQLENLYAEVAKVPKK